MFNEFITAIYLGVLLSFMVGPVFFVLIETSVTKGFRAAIAFDFGVFFADICFIILAYFSSYQFIEKIKDEPLIFIIGGSIMILYGIISYIKLKNSNYKNILSNLQKKNYFTLFVKGFLINFINIGVLGFWFMIFIVIGPAMNMNHSRIFTFFSVILSAYFVVDVVKILVAKKLKSKLTAYNVGKIKKITSIFLIIFGVAIMLQYWFPSDQKTVKKALQKVENNNRAFSPNFPVQKK